MKNSNSSFNKAGMGSASTRGSVRASHPTSPILHVNQQCTAENKGRVQMELNIDDRTHPTLMRAVLQKQLDVNESTN